MNLYNYYNFSVKDLVSLSAARIKHLICSVMPLSENCFRLLCLCVFYVLFYVDFHVYISNYVLAVYAQ